MSLALNPIWIREIKQSARLGRTPIILMAATIAMTLVIASLGGFMGDRSSAEVGVAIYQTFFSIAFFLVTWVGPGVAANSIASEREGRTLEAVMLTNLGPEAITRGKFLTAMTFISTYIVMLAPVGALSFLFGGVAATEVLLAFVFLFAFALLFVALGLAISSNMSSLRASILVTLLLSVPLSLFCFSVLGVALSGGIHEIWRAVPKDRPVWLPTAYVRAEWGRLYVLVLMALPFLALAVPTWFLYESTLANLKSHGEDRSSGMKRWYTTSLVAMGVAAVVSTFMAGKEAALPVALVGVVMLAFFLAFGTLVFAGEPIHLSRRVKSEWQKRKTSAARRFFGPGAFNASLLQLFLGCITLWVVEHLAQVAAMGATTKPELSEGLGYVAAYTFGFFIFLVGFSMWLRTIFERPVIVRVLSVATIAVVTVVPWVVAAIVGVISTRSEENLFIAAPSPIYAFYMLDDATKSIHAPSNISAGWVCIVGWGALGLLFLLVAGMRNRRMVRDLDMAVAETDLRLAREDEQANAAPEESPPEAATEAVG